MLGIPVWGILLLLFASGSVSFLLYRFQIFDKVKLWILAFFLRWIALFLLLALLFNPSWQNASQWVKNPVILVYRDVSASVSSADQKRWNEMTAVIEKSGFEAKYFQFANGIRSVSKDSDLVGEISPFRLKSDLALVLSNAVANAGMEPVAGLIVMTDGIVNQGLDPKLAIIPPNLPLIAVAAGDSKVRKDGLVGSFLCNDEAFLGNSMVVEAVFRAKMMKGNQLMLRCLGNGNLLSSQSWVITGDQDWKRWEVEIKPQKLGVMKLEMQVLAVDGEINLANNLSTKFVRVVDNRKKVAIVFGSPHPDVAAIRKGLGEGGQFVTSVAQRYKPMVDADIYILHGWNFSDPSDLEWVRKWIGLGKTVLVFVSPQTRLTALGNVLGLADLRPSGDFQDVQPVLNHSFSGWNLDAFEAEAWQMFPPVVVPLLNWSAPAEAEVPILQKWGSVSTQFPLLAYWKLKDAQVGLFLGEGIWRWRIHDLKNSQKSVAFDPWIRRLVGTMAMGSNRKKLIEIEISANEFDAQDRVMMRVLCRDIAGDLDEKIKRKLELMDEKGNVREVVLSRSSMGWTGVVSGLSKGRYRAIATKLGGSLVKAERDFGVVEQPLELQDLEANHDLLRTLSAKSHGGFVTLGDQDALKQLIQKQFSDIPVMGKSIEIRNWWNTAIWLLLIGFCFGGEWFVRRWLGKY